MAGVTVLTDSTSSFSPQYGTASMRRTCGRLSIRDAILSRGRIGSGAGAMLDCGRARLSRTAAALDKLLARERTASAAEGWEKPKSSGRDRRQYPRRASGGSLAIVLAEKSGAPGQLDWAMHGCQWKGELIDVSMNGVAFRTGQAPRVGDELLVRMRNSRHGQECDARVTVLRVTKDPGGGSKVIGRFAQRLPMELAQALGNPVFESAVV